MIYLYIGLGVMVLILLYGALNIYVKVKNLKTIEKDDLEIFMVAILSSIFWPFIVLMFAVWLVITLVENYNKKVENLTE